MLELYLSKIKENNLQPDKDQERVAKKLAKLLSALSINYSKTFIERFFKKETDVKGLYIWGGVGRGKSMLMDMFYEALPSDIKSRRVHFHEFMIEVHDYLHKARKELSDKDEADRSLIKCAEKIAKESTVLCFDEFHVTDIADAMILGRLFKYLFSNGTIVIATSNWHPDRLYEGGLQRELFIPFISLLKTRMEVAELNGDVDYRLKCLTEAGVYFSPIDKKSRIEFENVFTTLTDYTETHEAIIKVKGREVVIPKVAKGVGMIEFKELCEVPLGAEDYLCIAKNFHTIFIEALPVLSDKKVNAVKRFMTLIDALYEQKIKLVILAEKKVKEIYSDSEYEYEFERTVSRLFEMQGEAYLNLDN
jgi:cell division protein ZapE